MTTFDSTSNNNMIKGTNNNTNNNTSQMQIEENFNSSTKNLTCPCGQIFYDYLKFIEHAKVCNIFDVTANNFLHKSAANHRCLECSQMMSSEFQLIQHCHKEHNKAGTYTCEQCQDVFGNLAKYLVHKSVRGQCCCIDTSNPSKGTLKCGLCQKAGFRQHSELLYHLNTCSINVHQTTIPGTGSSSAAGNEVDTKGQELLRRASMLLSQQQQQQKKSSEAVQNNPGMSDAARPFRCEHCVKSFKSKALLDQHMHIHFPPKYTCRYCSKKYRWPPVFYHHQRTCKKRLQPPSQTPNNNQHCTSTNTTTSATKSSSISASGEARMRRSRHANSDSSGAPNLLMQQLQSQGIIGQQQHQQQNHRPPTQAPPPSLAYFEQLLKALPNGQSSGQTGQLMNLLLTASTLSMKFPSLLNPSSGNGNEFPSTLFNNNNNPTKVREMTSNKHEHERSTKVCSNCNHTFDDLSTFLVHITTCRPSFKGPEMSSSNGDFNPFLSMINSLNNVNNHRKMSSSPSNDESPQTFPFQNPAQFLSQIEENRRLLEAQQSTNNSSSSSCGDPLSKTPPKTPEYVDEDYFNSLQPVFAPTSTTSEVVIQCQFCSKDFPGKLKLRQHFEESHAIIYRHRCDNCNKRFRWGPTYSYHIKACNEQTHPAAQHPFHVNYGQTRNFMADSLSAKYDFDMNEKSASPLSDQENDSNVLTNSHYNHHQQNLMEDFDSPLKNKIN